MLEELNIVNFGLIEKSLVEFTAGLNVITGETGAGKSMLIGALSQILGEKSEVSMIRTGASESVVSASVNIGANRDAISWLTEKGIEADDGQLIIRRVIKDNGRTSIYIQNSTVSRTDLKEFCSLTFDLHGQHEHQSLFIIENHRKLLDQFGIIEDEVLAFTERFSALNLKKRKYEQLLGAEKDRLRETDLLQFAVKEIDAAGLKKNEDESVEQEISLLSQHEKIFSLLADLHSNLGAPRVGAVSLLKTGRLAMDSLVNIDPNLSGSAKRLDDLYYELEDVVDTIEAYRGKFSFDPGKIDDLNARSSTIKKLKKKYGVSIDEILQYSEDAKNQLSGMENWDADKEKLKSEISAEEAAVIKAASVLSEKRKKTAAVLSGQITGVLQSLGMKKAVFQVQIGPRLNENGKTACGLYGFDQIEFFMAPNPGEPFKPLRSTASGGEISRVMLAIKSVAADKDRIGTIVFDEIDAGIGGEVALSVGEHLQKLASSKQILCITHLASIAVRADNHLKVFKETKEGRTISRVGMIANGEEKVGEIARMLAGDKETDASLNHARELLSRYSASSSRRG